jgi:hypothetical protein
MAELGHVKVLIFFFFKLPKPKNLHLTKKTFLKNHIFGTILFENLTIPFLLIIWMLKEPISIKICPAHCAYL